MKKGILTATVLVALSAGAAIAGVNPGSGIVGSAHDMNSFGTDLTADTQGRVCAFCHTPHHALVDPTGEQQPLWSHTFTTQNYKPYASPTLNQIIDPTDVLKGPSRLCMSCHDGLIAADQHYGSPDVGGSTGRLNNDLWNGVAIGKVDGSGQGNLSNDHPIGFAYTPVATNDTGIFNAAGRKFLGNPTGPTIADVLTDGFMTCATCHDVHNKDNVTNTGGRNYFVYGPQQGSQLCLTCHAKGSETKI